MTTLERVRQCIAAYHRENGTEVLCLPQNITALAVGRRQWVPLPEDYPGVVKVSHLRAHFPDDFKFCVPVHPHLVPEIIVHQRNYFYSFAPDLRHLKTLAELIESLSLYQKLKIILDVMQGLLCLHQHDYIHRDIKPANILVKESEEQKVGLLFDFKIAVPIYAPEKKFIGTKIYVDVCYYGYESSEQALPARDIFALAMSILKVFAPDKFQSGPTHLLLGGWYPRLNIDTEFSQSRLFFLVDFIIPEKFMKLRLLLKLMLVADPNARPSLAYVIEKFKPIVEALAEKDHEI